MKTTGWMGSSSTEYRQVGNNPKSTYITCLKAQYIKIIKERFVTLVNESVGSVTPKKNPNIIPADVVIKSLIVSFDFLLIPLQAKTKSTVRHKNGAFLPKFFHITKG